MALVRGPRIVRNGLVLHLDAAQRTSYSGSGATWYDLSGNRNNGTLTNGPTFSSANGGNIVYDGANDTVSVPHSSLYNVTAVTYLSFVKTPVTYTSHFRAIFSKQGADRDFNYYVFSSASNGVIDYFHFSSARIGGFNSLASIPNSSLTLDKWHQVGFSIDSVYLNYILNGSIIYSSTYTGTFNANSTYNLAIGSADNFWLGNIATSLLYNRALSSPEILQNYNATKTRFNL